MPTFDKKDRFGQVIKPGDLCVWSGDFVVYKKPSWGGSNSKGEYGQFITTLGKRSIRFKNVIFAFDPMGNRQSDARQIKELCREFYEG